MHKNQFMLLLNDIKRKLLACFYPLEMLCNTSFFQYDQLIFYILDFILLIAYQYHLFGLFFQNLSAIYILDSMYYI